MSGIPAGAGQLLGKRLGKFEIVALLALGGTAEIYLARIDGAAGFEKYVVVKCLHDHLADDPEFVKMFLDEARLAAHLDHSNIVQTMELGQHEGRYYMVMEFLAGLSLAMIVRRAQERLPGGRLPVPLVLNVLAQAAAGLHYAHDKAMNGKALNIVHRDISPQNLVISFEGVVKVVDFGIAKAEMRETHTRSGTIKGKFAYMSPEQCVANNVDRRTDVFALGVIGHELLTGRRLFKRASPYETYQAVLDCDVKPPSTVEAGLDPALDAILMRAITKDKESRYPTTEAFGDALAGYLHHRGISSGPGDVSRFFDAQFSQEIDEHSARMRELISGRELAALEAGWGKDEEKVEEVAPSSSASLSISSSESLDSLDRAIEAVSRPAADAAKDEAAMLLGDLDLGDLGSRDDDDEMPAERTRIEANPLDQVNELEKMILAARASSQKAPITPNEMPSIRAATENEAEKLELAQRGLPNLPPPANAKTVALQIGDSPAGPPPGMPPMPPGMPPSGLMGEPMSGPPPSLPIGGPRPPSGRFPDAASLPTMVAGAAMAMGGPQDGPAPLHPGRSHHGPKIPPSAQIPISSGVIGGLPENARTQIAPLPAIPLDGSSPPPLPSGYPVMSAEMRESIATGASVFPSEGAPHVMAAMGPGMQPAMGPGMQPGMQPAMGGYPGMHGGPPPGSGMYGAAGGPGMQHGQPGLHGGPPGSGIYGAAPSSGMYGGYGHNMHPMGSSPLGPPMGDAQHAANMMSPVGPQYANRVDWTAAASAKIRVMPPWLLAILFIAALGLALTLTIVIARLIA